MKNRTIYIIVTCLVILGIGLFVGDRIFRGQRATAQIITTNFAGYDFARAIMGDNSKVSMLLKPGTDMHDYEPTPEDIISIKNADLFIYNGSESDDWVSELLRDNEIPADKTLRLMDYVELKEEKIIEGMEVVEDHDHDHDHATESDPTEHHEYDEHIWTSPVNAMGLLTVIKDRLIELYPDKSATLTDNYDAYLSQLQRIDGTIRKLISKSSKRELIFADRFPFQSFVDEYNLAYYAAFPGCSEQTEASSDTIAFLIDKIKQDDIKVVLKIELTSGKLADTIAAETGAKVLEFNAAHNISQENFESGVTYVNIMEDNIKVLEEALK